MAFMCNGSIASAGPAVALPLGQQVVQATPRQNDTAPPPAPASSANPNVGRNLDISV
jgi:hypothetical protein